ncbi:E3 ubiquitin-protein ligase ZNRF2 [Madurella fahalii]|uniref:E3 ubiquitin-protein ligase ZNRF2 n=1 Tax=Madurella fahalii TaxID=1157608 RepID=A0ABQ0FXW4_9PEZI
MATRDGAGPSLPPDAPIHSSSASPSSSFNGGGHNDRLTTQHAAVCRWRTTRYHDQECSRYFDCPSHVVERALSDHEQDELEDEHHEEGNMGSENAEDGPDPGAVSPLSGDEAQSEDHRSTRSPSPDLPDTRLHGTSTSTGREEERPHDTRGRPVQRANSADRPIILIDRSPVLSSSRVESEPQAANGSRGESGGSREPTLPSPGTIPRSSRATAGLQAAGPTAPAAASPTASTPGPSAPLSTGTERGGPSEFVLPRWQPDAEVTYCPICHTQFSIFVRKHHCRKCGRVVCNSCSPHRITIPYQYIVQPPGAPRHMAQRPISLLDSQTWYPDFGGGERVRLCNPCVPDPNTAPPQTQTAQPMAHGNLGPTLQSDNNPVFNRWSLYFGTGPANDSHGRSRSVTMQPGAPSSTRSSGLAYAQNTESRILSGTPPAYYHPPAPSQAHHLYPGMAARYRSLLDVGNAAGPSASSSSSSAGPSSPSPAVNRRLPPIPVPQPQIAEEDECPVCHRELPPRTLANFETLRESHINTCITSHSRYGGGGGGLSTGGTDGGESPLPPMPPRRTGMFPYTATEKDCVDSAECTICLEEFEVGVAMARLECLCRFHRRCIAAWWERHPGRCPMHQHDGFGY